MCVEPQFRMKSSNGSRVDSYGFIPIPREGFYHHCGGKLALYPDYVSPPFLKCVKLNMVQDK